jgi:PKD repeat protein
VTEIFPNPLKIFSTSTKLSAFFDGYLNSVLNDLADVGKDSQYSTFFKVNNVSSQGRYAYIGWFYKLDVNSLTEDGKKLLNRTLVWLKCGDDCLTDSNVNKPPKAFMKITPNPIASENQVITFDASNSFDPEGMPLNYFWDFGDGTNSGFISSAIIARSYQSQGKYNVTLIVNDGELNSTKNITTITIVPTIKNKVALVCGDTSCSGQNEQKIVSFLSSNGYFVGKGTEKSWTKDDLNNYDMIVCASMYGCNIHSWSAVYDVHVNKFKGFLEIPDSQLTRAGYQLGYVSWYAGQVKDDKTIQLVTSDTITSGFSGSLYLEKQTIAGNRNLNSGVIKLANFVGEQVSTMFKVEPTGNRGRYLYIGWLYDNQISDLTNGGRDLLLKSIKWVQCGNVNSC